MLGPARASFPVKHHIDLLGGKGHLLKLLSRFFGLLSASLGLIPEPSSDFIWV
jgi:hypothetical protein